MQTLRLNFSKTEDAKYLSHLDLTRCFTRAIRRSGLDVWYTEGFNSHLYMLFALPLALGFESFCEALDVKVLSIGEDIDVTARINPFLPKGIEVFNSFLPKHKHKEIAYARYFIEIDDNDDYLTKFDEQYRELLFRESLVVEKKGKKGIAEVDIRKQIHESSIKRSEETLSIDLLVDAGNAQNLNPMLLLDEVYRSLDREPEAYRIVRVQILTGTRENFE